VKDTDYAAIALLGLSVAVLVWAYLLWRRSRR
jgi:LPXTG-motif cell wall-anchored protein